jgi:hypothetical protein
MKYIDLQILSSILLILIIFNLKKKNKKIWNNKIVSFEIDGESTNRSIIDIFTLTHINSGIILHLITKKKIVLTLICSILFEIIENSNYIVQKYKNSNDYNNYIGDSIVNIISDLIFVQIGFYIADKVLYENRIRMIVFLELFLYVFRANIINIVLNLF